MQALRVMIDRVLTALSGWVLLCAGLAIVAAGVLLPAWRSSEALRVQRDQMLEQAQWMQRQRDTYERVRVAVDQNDPLILQRLAFHHLRLKPEHAGLITVDQPVLQPGYPPTVAVMEARADEPVLPGFNALVESVDNVDAWALEPMDPAPAEPTAAATPPTRLNRLTTGTTRLLTTGFGLLCVLAGIWLHTQQSTAGLEEDLDDDEVGTAPPANA